MLCMESLPSFYENPEVFHTIHRNNFTFCALFSHIPTLYTGYPHFLCLFSSPYLASNRWFSWFLPQNTGFPPKLSTKLSTLSTGFPTTLIQLLYPSYPLPCPQFDGLWKILAFSKACSFQANYVMIIRIPIDVSPIIFDW